MKSPIEQKPPIQNIIGRMRFIGTTGVMLVSGGCVKIEYEMPSPAERELIEQLVDDAEILAPTVKEFARASVLSDTVSGELLDKALDRLLLEVDEDRIRVAESISGYTVTPDNPNGDAVGIHQTIPLGDGRELMVLSREYRYAWTSGVLLHETTHAVAGEHHSNDFYYDLACEEESYNYECSEKRIDAIIKYDDKAYAVGEITDFTHRLISWTIYQDLYGAMREAKAGYQAWQRGEKEYVREVEGVGRLDLLNDNWYEMGLRFYDDWYGDRPWEEYVERVMMHQERPVEIMGIDPAMIQQFVESEEYKELSKIYTERQMTGYHIEWETESFREVEPTDLQREGEQNGSHMHRREVGR